MRKEQVFYAVVTDVFERSQQSSRIINIDAEYLDVFVKM